MNLFAAYLGGIIENPVIENTYNEGKGIIKCTDTLTYIGLTQTSNNIVIGPTFINFGESSNLLTITLPDTINTIGIDALCGCNNLTSITLPAGINILGGECFTGSGLTSLSFTDSISVIPQYCCKDCSNLASVHLGSNVTDIQESAFENCTQLSSIVIPDTTTTIGRLAFKKCTSLNSVMLGASLTTIGDNPFFDCNNLPIFDDIQYADTYLVKVIDNNKFTYSIKTGTKWLGTNSF